MYAGVASRVQWQGRGDLVLGVQQVSYDDKVLSRTFWPRVTGPQQIMPTSQDNDRRTAIWSQHQKRVSISMGSQSL